MKTLLKTILILWFAGFGTCKESVKRTDTETEDRRKEDLFYEEYEEYADIIENPALLENNPQFVSESKSLRVDVGGTIRLPCQVDKLGPLVISWLKAGERGEHPEYFASGNILFQKENSRISLENVNDAGSTLVIVLAKPEDAGEYICETSSQPPARLRHQVSMIVRPKVNILKPSAEVIKVMNGKEIPLLCSGTGDPKPKFRWYRESMRMPDGRDFINGQQLIFKNVTRKHSGKYVCEGYNGSGTSARDSVEVVVQHPPEVSLEESYVRSEESVDLELSCLVHAFPSPKVFWLKDGIPLDPESFTLSENGGKQFIITLKDVAARHEGLYSCKASNIFGESQAFVKVETSSFFVSENLADIKPLFLRNSQSSGISGAQSVSFIFSILFSIFTHYCR